MPTIAERILNGREAEARLKDEFLNGVFDSIVEDCLTGIVMADDADEAWTYKLEIDAIRRLRKRLQIAVDDGYKAEHEQEMINGADRYQ